MKTKDILKAIVLSIAMTGIIFFFDEKSLLGMVVTGLITLSLIINMVMGLIKGFNKEENNFQEKHF